jgi:DNA-directed RNA polymerase subunit RPC12/RpoP
MSLKVCGKCGARNIMSSPDGKGNICLTCGFRGKMVIPRTKI